MGPELWGLRVQDARIHKLSDYGIATPRPPALQTLNPKLNPIPHKEGQGGLVSILITPISHRITPAIPVV